MMNRINNLLIGLLWLLASTLGATFWFNTMFGFNIFSLAHWQHLAYMQATGQAVKPTFYISIVVIVLVMLFGLYKLLQPRFRHITMPIFDRENSPAQSQTITTSTQTVVQPVAATKPAAPAPTETHTVTPPEQKPVETTTPVQTPTAPTTTSDPTLVRPPRLNIPTVTRTTPIPQVPLTTATPTTTPRANPETEYAEIRNIFESAGYVFKGMPKIKGVQTATVAIGTGEVLWIGGVGVTNADMRRAVQREKAKHASERRLLLERLPERVIVAEIGAQIRQVLTGFPRGDHEAGRHAGQAVQVSEGRGIKGVFQDENVKGNSRVLLRQFIVGTADGASAFHLADSHPVPPAAFRGAERVFVTEFTVKDCFKSVEILPRHHEVHVIVPGNKALMTHSSEHRATAQRIEKVMLPRNTVKILKCLKNHSLKTGQFFLREHPHTPALHKSFLPFLKTVLLHCRSFLLHHDLIYG